VTRSPKKHGVYVTESKGQKTKQVWVRGERVMTYLQQPKKIRFKSRMVNDANQNLCGGWHMRDCSIYDEGDEILRRVSSGLKPMGIAHALKEKAVADRIARDLTKRGLDVKIVKHEFEGWNLAANRPETVRQFDLVAARPGTLRELFDLETLARDYIDNGVIPEDVMRAQLKQYADRRLISFAEGYDWETLTQGSVPPWVTGLILGFPIENTISLYSGAVF